MAGQHDESYVVVWQASTQVMDDSMLPVPASYTYRTGSRHETMYQYVMM